MNDPTRTIVFDVDDTLTLGKADPRGTEQANVEVAHEVRRLYKEGWRIVLHTARGWARPGGVAANAEDVEEEIEIFCSRNNIPYHELVLGKPAARYYVDDRGMDWREFLVKTHTGEL
ncbi:capsule biosynthesis phosphatase [Synechococcus phage S-CBWM1]|uniref:Capsule biosynthesis phosphatase n=1 Tax=Synechococcus phage S-CBWM1 TaxID=2053653 RepID=A0A3G1L3C4_9CAUD|nr:phosphoheptose isomerase [Synechococcus phage S-CBWM1]ATW62694.1 capsule biosynthesis phosphatase [Synechococcus phage S-CBWM1]